MRWPFGVPATILLVLIAGVIYLAIEPLTVFDYDSEAIAESLEGELEFEHGNAECNDVPGGWRCVIQAKGGTAPAAAYDLMQTREGCWRARPIPYQNVPPQPDGHEGCVDLLDVTGISSLGD